VTGLVDLAEVRAIARGVRRLPSREARGGVSAKVSVGASAKTSVRVMGNGERAKATKRAK